MATVDFSGNIGGVALYGKLLYGKSIYSQGGPFAPSFAGSSLSPLTGFVGDLAPAVSFGADISVARLQNFVGDLAPQVRFNADLSLIVSFTTIMLDGGFYFTVDLAGSSMISAPLWGASAPCPPPPWTESEPCPPSLWTPSDPCEPVAWEDTDLCNG